MAIIASIFAIRPVLKFFLELVLKISINYEKLVYRSITLKFRNKEELIKEKLKKVINRKNKEIIVPTHDVTEVKEERIQ